MTRWITLSLSALMLSGCFHIPRPVTLPDGSAGHTISRCRYLASCLKQAEQTCGGPYEIKSQSESFNQGFTIMIACKAK